MLLPISYLSIPHQVLHNNNIIIIIIILFIIVTYFVKDYRSTPTLCFGARVRHFPLATSCAEKNVEMTFSLINP